MATGQLDLAFSDFPLVVPEASYNNSAGRMLALLQGLRTDVNYYCCASMMFEGGLGSSGEIQARLYLRFMTMLRDVHDELCRDVEASPGIPEQIRPKLAVSLGGLRSIVFPIDPARNVPRGLTDAEFQALEFAGALLVDEGQVQQGDIDEVLQLVDALMAELDSADIDQSVRESLMELARHARFAVDHYRIYGAKGFREAFKRMMGELYVACHNKDSGPKDKGWREKVLMLLGKVDQLATRLEKYSSLLEAGRQLLLPGS